MELEKIISLDEIRKNPAEHKFVPEWRNQCLTSKWPNGEPHEPSKTWIKITKIEKLKRAINPQEMKKSVDGRSLKRVYVRRNTYILDEDWE
ncbi:MAG: hypothetical protein JW724_07360 [Candidatus Altiarchaeota archaeon]|nr:hypothetical protein [Candidatus Altiarchaeota archaeon]